jgi:molybdate transport system ATP-binding protein
MNLRLQRVALPLRDFVLQADLALGGPATALFGPSGAGKTSLLDLIAGLRRPAAALIELEGRALTDTMRGLFVPPRLRRIGYVAQDLALFPHLSVRKNILYGARAEGGLFSLGQVLQALELEALLESGVASLSGGEQQRVALARALMASPQLLLLDEPLASLDDALKARILPLLVRVRDEFRVPMIYVTHDRAEARALCGEVVEIHRGQAVRQVKIVAWTE